jgi:hypothetical protein
MSEKAGWVVQQKTKRGSWKTIWETTCGNKGDAKGEYCGWWGNVEDFRSGKARLVNCVTVAEP